MRTSVVLLTIALLGSLLVRFAFGVSLGVALLLFFVGWPLGGTLVTIDDDLRGGWSNPDGSVRPSWLEAPFWGQISAGLAISALGFGIDAGWRSSDAFPFWLLAVATGFLAAALFTRRWWLLAGALVGLGALWR